jgi:hypothetical protein
LCQTETFFIAQTEPDEFEGQIEKFCGFAGLNCVLLSGCLEKGYKIKQGVIQGQLGKD